MRSAISNLSIFCRWSFFVLIRSWGAEDWTRSMPFWGWSGGWGKSFQGTLTLFISTCDSANASLDFIWHISACGWVTIEIQLFWRSSFGKEVGVGALWPPWLTMQRTKSISKLHTQLRWWKKGWDVFKFSLSFILSKSKGRLMYYSVYFWEGPVHNFITMKKIVAHFFAMYPLKQNGDNKSGF